MAGAMSEVSQENSLWEPSTEMRQFRKLCAQVFGVEEMRLLGRNRSREISNARQATCLAIRRRFPSLSLHNIGILMAGLNHTTVLHGCRQTEERLLCDAELAGKIMALAPASRRLTQRKPQDAHVLAYLAYRQTVATIVEFDDQTSALRGGKRFCSQCDYAVTAGEVARCTSAFCSFKTGAERAA